MKSTLQKKESSMAPRPPVIVVMGHIDHGKTTLLDSIRATNVAARESGGITQHIGAYEVVRKGKRMTFIDTPGHEAFSRMRTRGARVADIAVLVVAADDGVKPQTLEALHAIQEAHVPYVVVLNKIDKPDVQIEKIKNSLAEEGVLLEGWGGSVPVAEVSAKTGAGIEELLDLVQLLADVEELTGDPAAPASGVVIESHVDARRGITATLLIKNGTLHTGDWLKVGSSIVAVKIMENDAGGRISDAACSRPVRVVGFGVPPAVGEEFTAYADKASAEAAVSSGTTTAAPVSGGNNTSIAEHATVLFIVLKTDVAGSCEAIEGELEKIGIPGEATIHLLRSGVGDISDDDIKNAAGRRNTVVVGFKVKTSASVRTLAERHGVSVHTFDIIYELLEWLRGELEKRMPGETQRTEEGRLTVLKIFKQEKRSHVLGGKVTAGAVKKGALCDVTRGGTVVGTGRIVNLQRNKVDATEVHSGFECGLAIEAEGAIHAGDVLALYHEEVIRKKLD